MIKRLDANHFSASHSAHTVRSLDAQGMTATRVVGETSLAAAVLGYFRLAHGQAMVGNFFSNGAQKYQIWPFIAEAPQGAIGGSLAEIASGGALGKARVCWLF
jgi:hypothetical protein